MGLGGGHLEECCVYNKVGGVFRRSRITALIVMNLFSMPRGCQTLNGCIECLLPEHCLKAAALMVQEADDLTSLSNFMDEGCIATVIFEFLQHPEWLQEGARLIVHDRTDNCLSGAGFVRRLFWQP